MRVPTVSGIARAASSSWWSARIRALGVEYEQGLRLLGQPDVTLTKGSRIQIGSNVSLISNAKATALGTSRAVTIRTLTESASIIIGRDTGISGTSIVAADSITIGSRCLIGADCMIFDTDFHPVHMINRRYLPVELAATAPVIVGDDVFVGARSILAKGITVGDGCVIGAGSVVVRSVEPGLIVAGNPAREVGRVG